MPEIPKELPSFLSRHVDVGEFARFFLTGVTATVGNMLMVSLAVHVMAYRFALIAGLATGFVISFVMGKLFAFRSRSAQHSGGELKRFLIVYAVGAALLWGVGMVVGLHLAPLILPQRLAELCGVLAGASIMVVTSYFGHRFYTYAHLRRAR